MWAWQAQVALLLLAGACLGEGRVQNRNEALIGWTEQEQDQPCADQQEGCSQWARQVPSECLVNPSWMRRFCAASCGACAGAAAGGPWAGHATAAGTARFAAGSLGSKAAEGHFRRHAIAYTGIGSQEPLTLSSLGVGTYLGGADEATDDAVTNAIIKSVASGWNVIDTAANYRWGRAEKSVGAALRALRAVGSMGRDELFVSTKAGYAAEDTLSVLRSQGSISHSDVAGGHCMHPACLEASLGRSLESLGLETVDLLYIHNAAESQLRAVGRPAFMQRLRAAFEFCERARQAGQVKTYGLATWSCFRTPPSDTAQHLSLREVVRLAEEVGGVDHGFRYIQLPLNVGMREAWSEPWQGGQTLLQAAQQLGIGVFSSGPLMEARLLQSSQLQGALQAAPQLGAVEGTAPKLLQLARSTPGLLTTLVGHKTPANVDANLALTQQHPLGESDLRAAMATVLGGYRE